MILDTPFFVLKFSFIAYIFATAVKTGFVIHLPPFLISEALKRRGMRILVIGLIGLMRCNFYKAFPSITGQCSFWFLMIPRRPVVKTYKFLPYDLSRFKAPTFFDPIGIIAVIKILCASRTTISFCHLSPSISLTLIMRQSSQKVPLIQSRICDMFP